MTSEDKAELLARLEVIDFLVRRMREDVQAISIAEDRTKWHHSHQPGTGKVFTDCTACLEGEKRSKAYEDEMLSESPSRSAM